MQSLTKAFTLVELVVVIIIIAILSTTGFIAYTGYIDTGRDTNRLVQLSNIRERMQVFSMKYKLPLPEGSIELTASGAVFAYQGNLNEEIIELIGYSSGGRDPDSDKYPVYMLSSNKKDFQLMTFLSKPKDDLSLFQKSYAISSDYEFLFPHVIGAPLGILLDSNTQEPVHLLPDVVTAGTYDIISGTEALYAYTIDADYIDSNDRLISIIPNHSCKRILEMGKSSGSKIYTIQPDGVTKIKVYCDMDTDGGGWTFFGHVNDNTAGPDFSFASAIGAYRTDRIDDDTAYSINASQISHTEMMVTLDSADPIIASKNSKIVFYKYELGALGFYTGPNPCSGLKDGFSYKIDLGSEYTNGIPNTCNSTHWYTRDSSDNYLTLFLSGGPYGNYWGIGMGGDNGWYHDGWWYVR